MKTPPPSSFAADLTSPSPESPKENPVKYYYLYIGGGVRDLDVKNKRFVIESKKLIRKTELVQGKVVARNKGAYHELGTEGNNWTNPVHETDLGLYPVFVRVPQEWVEETKFFEKNL